LRKLAAAFFAPLALLPTVGREYPLTRAHPRILEGFGTHSAAARNSIWHWLLKRCLCG